MAPLYHHLAHPEEGVLNTVGEGSAKKAPPQNSRRTSAVSRIVGSGNKSIEYHLPWDEVLYQKLVKENEEELESFTKEEEEAAEKAGDTEVQAAKGKRAEFWARVGDRVRTGTHFSAKSC